jgi:hypothetical protein
MPVSLHQLQLAYGSLFDAAATGHELWPMPPRGRAAKRRKWARLVWWGAGARIGGQLASDRALWGYPRRPPQRLRRLAD